MSFVEIKSNIIVKLAKFDRDASVKNARVVGLIERMAVRALKRNAPVASGKFKRSIRAVPNVVRETRGETYGLVRVKPTAKNSVFVLRRTKASPGMYVPAIKKRVKVGRHPGTAANNFIRDTRPEIISKAKIILFREFQSFGGVQKYIR